MKNETITAILQSNLTNVSGFARIMNPERPQVIHNKIRNKTVNWTEEEVERLMKSEEFKELLKEFQTVTFFERCTQ